MRPALSIDLRVQQSGEPGAIRGRRHRDQPQFRAQHALQIAAQRERQVGFQRTLVHLVQDHRGDAVEPGIGLQPTDQQAFGDDLDAGRRRDGGIQPGAVPDLPPTASPSSDAMRVAAARVASRRGSSIRMRPSPRHGARAAPAAPAWSCRRPAVPTSTTLRPAARVASSAGMASVTGSSGNMLAIRRDLRHMRTKVRGRIRGHPWHARLCMPS